MYNTLAPSGVSRRQSRPPTLLKRLGVTVDVPLGRTRCGQPMANAGCERDVLPLPCPHPLRPYLST